MRAGIIVEAGEISDAEFEQCAWTVDMFGFVLLRESDVTPSLRNEELYIPAIFCVETSRFEEESKHKIEMLSLRFSTAKVVYCDRSSFLSQLNTTLTTVAFGPEIDRKPLIRNALAYAFEHLSDDRMTVAQIAKAIHVSEAELYSNFKVLFSKSPWQCVREMRFAQFERLMLETTQHPADIALKLGMNVDNLYFDFKKFTGRRVKEIRETCLLARHYTFEKNIEVRLGSVVIFVQ